MEHIQLDHPNLASLPFIANLRNLETLIISQGNYGSIDLPQLDLPHLQYLRVIGFHIVSLDFILSMPKLEYLKITLPPQPLHISPQVAERLAKIKVLKLWRNRKLLNQETISQSLRDFLV